MATELEEMVQRAKTLISERRHQEAVRTCRRVLLSQPDLHEVRLLLGTALLALRRHDEVRAEMLGLLRRHPNVAAAHRLLGEAYLRDGQLQRAQKSLRHAVELDPDDQAAREILAEAEEEEGRHSPTVDRWFDPEAVGTVETELEGEQTVVQDVGEDPAGREGAVRPTDLPRLLDSDAPPSSESFEEPEEELVGEATVARPRGTAQIDVGDMEEVSILSLSELSSEHELQKGEKKLPSLDEALPYARTQARTSGSFSSLVEEDELPPQEELDEEPTRARAHGSPSSSGLLPLGPGGPLAPSPHSVLSHPGPGARSAPLPEEDAGDAEPTRARARPEPQPRFRAPPSDLRPATRDAPAPRRVGAGASEPPASSTPASSRTPAVSLGTDRARSLSREARRALAYLPARTRFLLLAVPALVLLGMILGVVFWFAGSDREELLRVVQEAGDDGLSTTFARAIALDAELLGDEPKDMALRARLYATAIVEHGGDTEAQANGLLGQLGGRVQNFSDARVALAYLALARGDLRQVPAYAKDVAGDDDAAIEAARVQALAALDADDLDSAFEHARTAVTLRPTAPRHVALYALLLGLRGDVDQAMGLLEGLERSNDYPVVRVARARILRAWDLDRAAREADVVLDRLSSLATPPHKAWAHLIRAQRALADADRVTASKEAERAGELAPRGAGRLSVALIRCYLDLGKADLAGQFLKRLPTVEGEDRRRSLLHAEVALERGDMEGARRALREGGASDSPRASFIRGRVEEVNGNLAAAKGHYREAAEDEQLFIPTRLRLAAIAMGEGDPEEAIRLLESAQGEGESPRPEVVSALVDALIANKDLDRAGREIGRALTTSEQPPLVLAKARVEMAMGQSRQAVKTLDRLQKARPRNAAVLAAYGMTVRRQGDLEAARKALGRALELDSRNHDALLGRAEVVLDGGDVDAAREAVGAVREGGVPKHRLHGVEGRLKMLEGMGQEALAELRAVPPGQRDAATWSALGWAYLEKSEDSRRTAREAERAFQAALKEDPGYVDAHLGLGYQQVRSGYLRSAAKYLDDAERYANERNEGRATRARIQAIRARIHFQNGHEDEARELLEEAERLDPKCSEAHFVSALVAGERSEEGKLALRKAAVGRRPMPESWGLLVAVRGVEGDPCELARRYISAAPDGIDADAVHRALRHCR